MPVQRASPDEQFEKWCVLAVGAIALLVFGGLALICGDALISSIDYVAASGYLKKRFIAMVIIPLLAEGPDRLLAIQNASSGRIDRAAEFALGRGVQTAIFVTPLMILLGLGLSTPESMTLRFGRFETISLFLGILLVIELMHKKKCNYMDGAICLAT
jgi:Ca2+:H+ antiporter